MIQAQLHGKAPTELTWSEDVLTSNVFGMLKYLCTPDVIINILQSAINLENRTLIIPHYIMSINYFFWPRLQQSEPDLVLVLDTPQGVHVIGVEAKYFSGKSSLEDYSVEQKERTSAQRDQLAREIEDLCDSTNFSQLGIQQSRVLSINMVYLTLESYMPFDELIETIRSIEVNANCTFSHHQLYWLSWKSIYNNLKSDRLCNTEHLILEDLRKYLIKKDLKSFSGFSVANIQNLTWVYINNQRRGLREVCNLLWNYGSVKHGSK